MSRLLKSLDPLTLATLDGLTLRARHIIEGFVAGSHRSPFRGVSVEFSEHREYVPGDEMRHVDWKAFARTDKYYVKQFVDETNHKANLLFKQREPEAFKLKYGEKAERMTHQT